MTTDFATARTHMVDRNLKTFDVRNAKLLDAMSSVPREQFVPQSLRRCAYAGKNLDLGNGRYALDPCILAKMLEALKLRSEHIVLDVGCGLGYSTMVLSRLVETVVAIEEDEEMAQKASDSLDALGVDNVAVLCRRLADGASKHSPYNAILINGSIEFLPDEIGKQLAENGRLVAIEGDRVGGSCLLWEKLAGRMHRWRLFDASAPILPGFAKEKSFTF